VGCHCLSGICDGVHFQSVRIAGSGFKHQACNILPVTETGVYSLIKPTGLERVKEIFLKDLVDTFLSRDLQGNTELQYFIKFKPRTIEPRTIET